MDHQDKKNDSGSGNRRTYDCNICKRGFTNPQALGGHNNIHRKERGRNHYSSSSSNSFPFSFPLPSQSPSSSTNFTNLGHNNNNPPPYFPTVEPYHHQVSHPPINPTHNTQYFGSSSIGGRGNYTQGEEFHGLNLSLGLGSLYVDDGDTHQSPPETGASQPQNEDLDLDLRLGRRHH